MRDYRPLSTPRDILTRSEILFYWDYQNVRAANENYLFPGFGTTKSIGQCANELIERLDRELEQRQEDEK